MTQDDNNDILFIYSMNPSITPLVSANAFLQVGGKALNLGLLIKNNFNVPNGFVIPTDYVEIETTNNELQDIFQKLNCPLIVRSSATVEDGITTSFAGQFESMYPITSYEELVSAVIKVKKSAESEKISNYLQHFNIPKDDFRLAVIIQEYKQPVCSGVAFIEVKDDKKIITIEASQQSAGVVDGTSQPLRYIIDYSKKQIIGTYPTDDIFIPLNELIEVISTIENTYKEPQDIEWIYDGKELWIVQSRPVSVKTIITDDTVNKELKRLEDTFGSKPSHLTANQFAEGIEFSTPITTSLLQKIFSVDGSLGQVMRCYFVPFKAFDSEKYVVSVFGRLFLNKDYENDFLFSRIPRKPTQESTSLAMPLHTAKWYYPGLVALFKMFPSFIMLYIGDTKFQIDAYRNYKKLQIIINNQQKKRADTIPLTVDSAREVTNRIINVTTPILFKISLFQQFSLSFLEKKIKPFVRNDEWQKLITTNTEDTIIRTISNTTKSKDEIFKKLEYRGFKEIELSQPRWGEDKDKFFKILEKLEKNKKDNNEQKKLVQKLREDAIQRFTDTWDQQMVSTFFSMYDRFSSYREQMHDIWIQDFSLLRNILLQIDQESKLYNTIWYLTVDELLNNYPNYDIEILSEKRREHEALKKIPLPGKVQVKSWSDLIKKRSKDENTKTYTGFGLTPGYAEGKVGTTEMINEGETVDILVVKNLDPAITIYYENIKGVVTEIGGQLAHASIIAREYSIPVVTLENATNIFEERIKVSIDGLSGEIIILNQRPENS